MDRVKLLNAAVTALLCLVCIVILAVVLSAEPREVLSGEPAATRPEATTAPAAETAPSIRAEAPVFRGSAEDFIACYNALYYADRGRLWLSALSDWHLFPEEVTPCLGLTADRYEFDPDSTVHNESTISLYIHQGQIREVSVVLPEHDWTQWRYEMFLEQSRYALRVFFPELSEDEIDDLVAALFEESQNAASPPTIHCQGAAGCYAYTENGVIHINIIPIGEETGLKDRTLVPVA